MTEELRRGRSFARVRSCAGASLPGAFVPKRPTSFAGVEHGDGWQRRRARDEKESEIQVNWLSSDHIVIVNLEAEVLWRFLDVEILQILR